MSRKLNLERLEQRLPLADLDDSLTEAISLGAISTTALTRNDSISPSDDVDMYRFTVAAGQTVDFDIDTTLNGPGGLGSFVRLFNAQGFEIAFNNDGAAPGENFIGFDAYLRFTFNFAGTFFLGVSNATNTLYNANTGEGDVTGGPNAVGNYQLIVQALPVDTDDTLAEATLLGAIPAVVNDSIRPDIDVDLYRFTVAAGQTVDFDIDTPLNGPGGLGSFLRLFNSQGAEIAFNDDAAAPGESSIGFDSYLRFTFATAGTFFIGVSNNTNTLYNPVTGGNDAAGGLHSVGSYQLVVQTPPAIPADADDSIAEAIALGAVSATPAVANGSISPDVDVDLYSFTVTAGQTVDFDIDTPFNGPGGLGSFLRLFNAQGQELAFNDDARAPGENQLGFDAYLRFTFATAGTFYIGVSNVNNTLYNAVTGGGDAAGGANATGSYQLIVQALPIDSDDSLTEATSLGVISVTPALVNGGITPDIDVDLYAFTVTAGQVVDFDIDTALNGPGGLGSFLRLFNSLGQELAFNDDAVAPGENVLGFDSYLRFVFATAGTFFIGVSNNTNTLYNAVTGGGDAAGGLNSVGNYQLSVQTAPVIPADPDDSLGETIPLGAISTIAAVVNGAITPDVDVDLYSFTVSAGQVVDFDIDTAFNGPGGLGSFLRLFNAQGQEIAFNNDAAAPGENVLGFDAYLRFTFATAGTFFVGVSNNNNTLYNALTGGGDVSGGPNATGSYQLIVQALPVDLDDSLSEAIPLGAISTTPDVVNDSISLDIDVDLYSFTVSAGQVVDFDIDTPFNGPGGLGSFLRVFNAQGQELAFNDDAVAPGESQIGFDAYLRFTFATAGTFFVGVSNNTNTLYNAVTGGGDAAGGQNSIGSYQLSVQTPVVAPLDPDDTLGEAISLGAISTTAAVVNGSITPDVDVDLYAFTVAAGQVVDFDIDTGLNGPGGLESFLRVFNSLGQELAFNDDAAAPGESLIGFDAYVRFTFATAGTYFVGVSNVNNTFYNAVTGDGDSAGGQNSTGSYQLLVQTPVTTPIDLDDSISEAIQLGAISATPVVASGSITPDVDVDMHAYAATAGQVIDFDLDTPLNGPGGLGSYLRLFNAQGQELAFNDNAAAPGESLIGFDAYLRFTFAAAGTYYIGVSNSNNTLYNPLTGASDTAGGTNATGSYQLSVTAVPVGVPTLTVTINATSIPEQNGTALGAVSRGNTDLSQPLTVTLTSSDTLSATVPPTVVIPANQPSATFTITAVHDTTRGTRRVTITAAAAGLTTGNASLLVTDSDRIWHNAANPTDVNNNGKLSPMDAILVINHLNAFGAGPVPIGNPPPFIDVDGNNIIAPFDAVLVINAINAQAAALQSTTLQFSSAASAASALSLESIDLYFAQLSPFRKKGMNSITDFSPAAR